ncbi:KilA-N domain-containing protein [Candidatus Fukatsuia endosymbiont of Tuberolachnus salignus]|uniref:KilA-N domain-containing protein n=1 Tax=Candidatus Fukatsuia endosymbiont of Tuberolachnus salignus TaxID=3077957 RepID=UPI00313EAC28
MKSPLVFIENTPIRSNEYGIYHLNDMHKAAVDACMAKKWQVPSQFLNTDGVVQYIEEVTKVLKNTLEQNQILKTIHGGNSRGTWAHELIALRYAAWLSPAFEFKVYQTFHEVVIRRMSVMAQLHRLDRVINREEKTISDCARKMRHWGRGGRKTE